MVEYALARFENVELALKQVVMANGAAVLVLIFVLSLLLFNQELSLLRNRLHSVSLLLLSLLD